MWLLQTSRMGHSFGVVSMLTVFFALHAIAADFTITDEYLDPEYLAKSFADILAHRITETVYKQITIQNSEGSERGSLIPPDLIGVLPNIPLGDGTLNFDNLLLSGSYEHENTQIQGLNTLWDDLLIYIQTPLTVTYGIGFKDLAIRGNYSLGVGINLTYLAEHIPDLFPPDELPEEEFIAPFAGNGSYELGLKDVHLNISIAFNISAGRIVGINTGLALGLDAVRIYFEDLVFNDVLPFDPFWDFMNEFLKGGILTLWAQFEDTLTELLDEALTKIFESCLIVDFLNGDLSCLLPSPPTNPPGSTLTPVTQTGSSTPDSDLSTTEKSGASHAAIQFSIFLVAFLVQMMMI